VFSDPIRIRGDLGSALSHTEASFVIPQSLPPTHTYGGIVF